jgi:hypothetical protein
VIGLCVPKRLAVFGIEPMTIDSYPTQQRAACMMKPLPFYWIGELLVEVPEHLMDKDNGSRAGIRWPLEWDAEMHAMLEWVRTNYVLLSSVGVHGWYVFDGDHRAVLAREMLNIAEHDHVPERDRIAMAGRLIERASRVPGRVVFYGR